MFTATSIINAYARNLHLIEQLTAGFSHADSLIQPPVPGNCVNWIVGHIAAYRNRILTILGQPVTLDATIAVRYARDSKPVLGDEVGIGQFPVLFNAIKTAQPLMTSALENLTSEQAQLTATYPPLTLSTADWMVNLLRHEGYHTGQLELLQELVKREGSMSLS